jgi:hypothetical protein
MKLTTLFASEHITFVQIRSSDSQSVLKLHLRNRMIGITFADAYDAVSEVASRRKPLNTLSSTLSHNLSNLTPNKNPKAFSDP